MKSKASLKSMYEHVIRIHFFEEQFLDLFSQGKLAGRTHAYIGQEANAVGVINALQSDDKVVSNHRCHGHSLAFKNNSYALLCEMMGKADGLWEGRWGGQRICDGNFFSNGVQGGILPLEQLLLRMWKLGKIALSEWVLQIIGMLV